MTVDVPTLLSGLSAWTWQFLREAPFRPREETVTEVLLTELFRRGGGSVMVRKSSTAEEHADGLDWAWTIRTDAGWVTSLVQAKQAGGRRFSRYPELSKATAATQATNLIHAAAMAGAVPLYAFFNSELSPFGPTGTEVAFGGCARPKLKRGRGLPWKANESPCGVTLAHAQDVLDYVVSPPASRQHARSVNEYALPWECIVCPKVKGTSSRTAVRVRSIPVHVRGVVETQSSDSRVDVARPVDRPEWLTVGPPVWAARMLDRLDPFEDTDDVPPVRYLVVVGAPTSG